VLAPAILATRWAWHEYQWLTILETPAEWPAVVFHEAGLDARQFVPAGRVLTLDPIIPLEGGLDIYPALVTGGIAWRAEPFVAPADRDNLIMMGPDNFAAKLEQTPPAAIFTTAGHKGEEDQLAWVQSRHWVPHLLESRGKIVDSTTVWTPPR
jgi:hypothetical protein